MQEYNQNIITKHNFKYLLIWALSVVSVKFYTLFIPDGVSKALVLAGTGVIVLFIFISLIYDRSKSFPMRYSWMIAFLFLSLATSTIAASYFHGQGFAGTLIAQYDFYFFSFYFLLHKLKPHPDKLLQMLVVLGVVFCIVYFVQWTIFPRIILNSKVFLDRGTVRIFMPGAGFLFCAYFLMLSGFFITKKPKYLLWLLPFLAIVFLLGTRQVLASIAFLTILNVMLSKTVKSKVLIYFLIVLCFIPVYFLFQGIFTQMMEVTSDQSSNVSDNIRLKAAGYFLFEFNKNPIWMLFGNGAPDYHSAYGRFITHLTETFGYYQSDIGIIGDFTKFGIFFVIGQLSIMILLIRSKVEEKYKFILYNILSFLMTMFTGSGLHASTISILCIMMYITDVSHYYAQKNVAARRTAAVTPVQG